ncbi:heat shock protein Hsp20 [Halothece sp. PCC 7418]|uniref:Hsp20/alpha crystallin family protein n=1 Tax=Halothece sp. (strain PCC 7418) TaxID=65093 RepID=UPI0002A0685D|nr:Hsp20/alpha crystallin family protein [Halothece sp. PCC 7418]AFZ42490.1 heat shock protein Hsp20 [Halothece sp. PCC 7418]
MALVRWNPTADMDLFRRQMDRLFDEMTGERPFDLQEWNPAIELNDAGENLMLKAQLPGLSEDDIDVTVNRDSVTISGEYRHEDHSERTYGSEFRYGKFSRTIGLPVGIKQDQVEADYTNGILSLRLPKVDDAVNRKVKINLGAQSNQAIAGSQQS